MVSSFLRREAALLPWVALGALALGLVELLVIWDNQHKLLQQIDYFLLAAGLSLGVMLPASLVLSGMATWSHALAFRTQRPRTIAAAVLGLAVLPYALEIGRFTFSGPRVVGLFYQPLLVLGATFLVGFTAAVALLIFCYRTTRVIPTLILGSLLLGGAGAAFLINQQVVPGQYEPLHMLLSVVTGVVLLLSMHRLGPLVVRRVPGGRSGNLVAFLLLTAMPFAALYRLPSAPKVGALLTQSSVTPRYLIPERGDSPATEEPVDPSLLARIKPTIIAPRSVEARRARSKQRPNIVLFFVDNLSPSRTGFLGYRKNPTTPNMDRLAERGAVFSQAYSSIPHTRYFTTSLLLGHYSHLSAPERPLPHLVRNSITVLLHRKKYRVMTQAWFELSRGTGFKPEKWGVDTFIRPPTPEQEAATDAWPAYSMPEILEKLGQHLDRARADDAPVFLWFHQVNPHGIPRGPGQYRADPQFTFGPTLDDRYDGAVASADQWLEPIARLISEKLPDPDNTFYILGSDHGSGINRFRKKVSKTTWQDHVHVPLALFGPGIRTMRSDYTVDSALDIAATILDLAGIDPPSDYDGISLLPLISGEWKPTSVRPVVLAASPWEGVILGHKKLVKNRGTLSLFDLSVDPDEQNDIADQEPELALSLGRLASEVLERRRRIRSGVAAPAQ